MVALVVEACSVPSMVRVFDAPDVPMDTAPLAVLRASVPSLRTVSPPLNVAVADPTVSVPAPTYATLVASLVAAPRV